MTKTVLVTGNTYPVKDRIKAMAGRWDPAAKGWRVPADKAAEAQALVAAAPKSSPRASSGRRYPMRTLDGERAVRVGRCWECGCVGPLDADGYCGC